MAQGDLRNYDQYNLDIGLAKHNWTGSTWFFALVDDVITPADITPDPRWGLGGGTDFQVREVTPKTGNYTANGVQLVNPTVSLVGGIAQYSINSPPAWPGSPTNPGQGNGGTNARWGQFYNNQAAKECIFYMDLGAPSFDMTTGDLTVVFANPIMTIDQG